MTLFPSPGAQRRAALVLAVLVLVVAASVTSYAAGVVNNSVGTAQLKNGAVTTPKLKANAVTGAQIKPGSVAASDLAPSARAPRTVTVARDTVQGSFALATVGGVEYGGQCVTDSPLDGATLSFDPATGVSELDLAGLTSEGTPTSGNALLTGAGSFVIEAPAVSQTAVRSFSGTATADGTASLVNFTVAVEDGAAKPCTFRLAVTPGS